MADKEHIKILEEGVDVWNQWRVANPGIIPDLRNAFLSKKHLPGVNFANALLENAWLDHVDFGKANFRGANLKGAKLYFSKLPGARLAGADLSGASLGETNLSYADFLGSTLNATFIQRANACGATFFGADLKGTDFSNSNLAGVNFAEATVEDAKFIKADLTEADFAGATVNGGDFTEAILYKANLSTAVFNKTNLFMAELTRADLREATFNRVNLNFVRLTEARINNAILEDCFVYGISAWNLDGKLKNNSTVIITPHNEPALIVDNLEVAQFIYLLLKNDKLHNVIDTITSKVVLILGNFSDKRKPLLDAIRNNLQKKGFTPLMFDNNTPASKDLTGTIELLARMARFIIADLTDPSSVPHELATLVPHMRTTPILTVRLRGSEGYSMFKDYWKSYSWALKTHEYQDEASLISELSGVIEPANEMAEQFRTI